MTDAATALLARARDLFSATDGRDPKPLRAALDEVGREYPAMAARGPSAADAETCRLAMLMAAEAAAHSEADIWRARCLARAAAVGWTAGIGSLVVSEAFRALSRENDDYPHGQTLDVLRPSETAERILDELEVVLAAPGDDPDLGHTAPTRAILRRFLHEKRGLLLLLSGRSADARECYRLAAEEVGEQRRGRIKVALGTSLLDYVEALDAGADTSPAREATERLGREAADAGLRDLAATAERNVAEMAVEGRRVSPYEIL